MKDSSGIASEQGQVGEGGLSLSPRKRVPMMTQSLTGKHCSNLITKAAVDMRLLPGDWIQITSL